MGEVKLTEAQLRLLRSWPAEYTRKATVALSEGKAFCPSCHSVGMSNCGYFDECGAFVEPTPEQRRLALDKEER